MAEREHTGPDRGALDFRGLLFLFIGLIGAFVFYANDIDGTRAAVWLVLFGGCGIALIARAFKQEKLAGLIVILVGIVAAVLLLRTMRAISPGLSSCCSRAWRAERT